MRKLILLTIILCIVSKIEAYELNLWSETAIVIDLDTEQILYEKNKNLIIPPASMTKLVTLYMIYIELESGRINRDDIVPISYRADYKNLASDSSLMFIEEGQIVSLFELMLGLAIPSGNDAAIAVAEYLYGSVENYMGKVHIQMKSLGLNELKFVDSSGFDDLNEITTKQFVEFCLILIKRFPIITEELFSVNSFTYPKKHNGLTSIGGIKQMNHNPIIDIFPGCDGLKTGFINKSGMNISLTASRNNRRVLAVLAGVKDTNKKRAEAKRTYDSITVLNYALNNFVNMNLDKIKLPLIKIEGSKNIYLKPIIPYKRKFSNFLNSTFVYKLKRITAPIELGEPLGVVYIHQGKQIYKFPISASRQILSIE